MITLNEGGVYVGPPLTLIPLPLLGTTGITAVRFAGGTKFNTPVAAQRIWGPEVPTGEKVYYRMKTASAVADTALINIRYHTH